MMAVYSPCSGLTPEAMAEPGARAGFLRAAREFGASPVEVER